MRYEITQNQTSRWMRYEITQNQTSRWMRYEITHSINNVYIYSDDL